MSKALTALAPGAALLVLAALQDFLERRMALHMVVELPLLFAVGWLAAAAAGARFQTWFDRYNFAGLTGFSAASAIGMFWMLPVSLDLAVLSPAIGTAKVASLLLAGAVARHSFAAARVEVQGFFILNWAWMTGTAGVLYQSAPQRLCSTYLQNDQAIAGVGIVFIAVVVTLAWIVHAFVREPAMESEVETRQPLPVARAGGRFRSAPAP